MLDIELLSHLANNPLFPAAKSLMGDHLQEKAEKRRLY
jgi:hypothetical protein